MKKLVMLLLIPLVIVSLFVGAERMSAASFQKDIIQYSKGLLGVPYKAGGTTTAGFDCSGFTQFVYKEFGIQLPRTSAEQYSAGQKIAKNDLLPGDGVFFQTGTSGVSHVGIYIGDNQFIHADSTKGITITNLDDPYYWKNKYVGAARLAADKQAAPPNTFFGLEIKEGQVGVIEVKKAINLWTRDENSKLQLVRVLQPGEKYRVYSYDNKYGGQYGLGGTFITNMPEHVTYYSMQ